MDDRRQWRVSHGSVTGTRHMRNGEVCQDHSCHLQMPRISGDTLVAAVADGMGSARLGGPGAHAASEAAATAASMLLWERRARNAGARTHGVPAIRLNAGGTPHAGEKGRRGGRHPSRTSPPRCSSWSTPGA